MQDPTTQQSSAPKPLSMSTECRKRLIKDVRELMKAPLEGDGIFYKHDEVDMLRGTAMIVGPSITPYFGGFFFFKFSFPVNYPYSPPLVVFCTHGDCVRFNPNLYTCGKVCVSILNTWRGEQWSSCITLKQILLHLILLLNPTPLLNEPGITTHSKESLVYNRIIEFKNVEIAILHMLKCYFHEKQPPFGHFATLMLESFNKNSLSIREFLLKKKEENPVRVIVRCRIFYMEYVIDYPKLLQEFDLYTATFLVPQESTKEGGPS